MIFVIETIGRFAVTGQVLKTNNCLLGQVQLSMATIFDRIAFRFFSDSSDIDKVYAQVCQQHWLVY